MLYSGAVQSGFRVIYLIYYSMNCSTTGWGRNGGRGGGGGWGALLEEFCFIPFKSSHYPGVTIFWKLLKLRLSLLLNWVAVNFELTNSIFLSVNYQFPYSRLKSSTIRSFNSFIIF